MNSTRIRYTTVFKLHHRHRININLNCYNNKFAIEYIHTESVHRRYLNVQRVSFSSDLMMVTNVNNRRYSLKSKMLHQDNMVSTQRRYHGNEQPLARRCY